MTCKEVINYASNVNYCEGCVNENNNKGKCMTCQKRDFYKTILETFTSLRKIHKATARNEYSKEL